jgi:hypothetical protein
MQAPLLSTTALNPVSTRAVSASAPLRAVLERVGVGLYALLVFFISIVLLEPVAPYDILAIVVMGFWLLLGLKVHRALVPFFFFFFFYKLGGFIGLIPYFDESDAVMFMITSLYLTVTAFFFACFILDKDLNIILARIELTLKAYTASCVFTSLTGIMGYFNLLGTADLFTRYERAKGTFQDPNVFGSFLTLGALYLVHNLLSGRTKRPLVSILSLLIILIGVLLSFSRGSWGGTLAMIVIMIVLTFITSTSKAYRRRILKLAAILSCCGILGIGGILSIDEIGEQFTSRAQATQDYDQGETGRFGNQKRSIPILLESPNGMGPLRFRRFFGIEPHNSYINGFASYGWLGGFAFIGLVFSTTFVGLRLCLKSSPLQRAAQIVFPALLMYFLQAFQIDIDHWRHLFLMFGLIWGMEAARQTWLRGSFVNPLPS